MKVHDYMYYEGEETRPAEPGPNFHGECWHVCPWCKEPFEDFNAFSRENREPLYTLSFMTANCWELVED